MTIEPGKMLGWRSARLHTQLHKLFDSCCGGSDNEDLQMEMQCRRVESKSFRCLAMLPGAQDYVTYPNPFDVLSKCHNDQEICRTCVYAT